ncbi:MAG: ATP-binding protein [Bacteroidia bacterium]|nr:ATP-binding protein [Bacteroidia bacterium]
MGKFVSVSFILFFFFASSILGQGESIEMLKKRAESSKGIVQLEALVELGKAHYRIKDFDTALKYAEFSVRLSNKLGKDALSDPNAGFTYNDILRKQIITFILMGRILEAQGREGKALRWYREAKKIAQKLNDKAAEERIAAMIDSTQSNKKNTLIQRSGKVIKNAAETLVDNVNLSEENVRNTALIRAKGRETAAKNAKNNGKLVGAIEQYEAAADLYKQAEDSFKVKEMLAEIENLYLLIGDKKEAEKIAKISAKTSNQDSLPIFEGKGNNASKSIKDLEKINNDVSQNIVKTKKTVDSLRNEIKVQVKEGNTNALERSLDAFERSSADYLNYKNDSIEIALEMDYIRQENLILAQEKLNAQATVEKERAFKNWLIFSLMLSLGFFTVLGRLFMLRRKDLSQLKTAYEELDQTHKKLMNTQTQLVSSEKMASLGQLTAGIAHEINNPINFISGNITPLKNDINDLLTVLKKYEEAIEASELVEQFAEVESLKNELEIDYITEEITDLLNGIDEGADRTTEIVKGLRNFARMEEHDIKPFAIHGGIDSTLALLKNQLKDIEVLKDFNFNGEIDAFPGKLNQVFMNIMSNAIHAMPDGGILNISTKGVGDEVEIRFRDTGVGMSEDVQKRIFEPFFTTKPVGEGTGLGMSITHGIIEEHKGRIRVNSTLGQGSELILNFPIKQFHGNSSQTGS